MMSALYLGHFHVKFGVVVRLAGDCGKLRLRSLSVRKQECGPQIQPTSIPFRSSGLEQLLTQLPKPIFGPHRCFSVSSMSPHGQLVNPK